MNCMVAEHGEDRIVLDCGMTFDGRGLGVDIIHPDFGWLAQHPARLRAIVLTHGHEDHIGAVPYLLQRCPAPVYGPPYALALVRERLKNDFADAGLAPELHALAPGDRVSIGPFEVEPYRVTHSMPDCTGLILRTPQGVVVHSGDFKIDEAPTDGQGFDFARLAKLRDEEGVRLLLSDSTNAVAEGTTGGEQIVADRLLELVREAPARVVVTLFASNVHRLRALTEVARATGRKLCLMGRSLEMHARLAAAQGYLPGLDAVRIPRELAAGVAREHLLVLATGTQGEPPAGFARLALGRHPDLTLSPGDRVIHSARIIPGNETEVYRLFNACERRGIEVLWRGVEPGVHVSGHAHRGEQRRLIELLAPRSFLPVHGTYLHMKRHAELARECGVEDVRVVENGAVVELAEEGLRVAGRVETGRIHRERGVAVPERVIKDRGLLAELGVAVVTAVVDDAGRPIAPVDLLTRGVLHEDENPDLIDDACDYVHDALNARTWRVERPDVEDVEIHARRALKRFFAKTLRKKPLCYAVVMRP
jgi:ribonuclease J